MRYFITIQQEQEGEADVLTIKGMSIMNNQQKGYKNLILQILQLKNFLSFLGLGSLFLFYHLDPNSIWAKAERFFYAWLTLSFFWLLFILIVYRGELENRILSYFISLAKKTVPMILIILAMYLILWPPTQLKTIGIAILTLVYLFSKKDKLAFSSRALLKDKKWVATETNNAQGTDFLELDLGGKSLREVEFKVTPHSSYWRAGIKICDPNNYILPLLSPGSLLFHIGSTGKIDELGITSYVDGNFSSREAKVIKLSPGEIKIRIEVNDKNFIKCFVNESVEYEPSERINPRVLKKAFLAAWGDGNPYRVEFYDVRFKFRE